MEDQAKRPLGCTLAWAGAECFTAHRLGLPFKNQTHLCRAVHGGNTTRSSTGHTLELGRHCSHLVGRAKSFSPTCWHNLGLEKRQTHTG